MDLGGEDDTAAVVVVVGLGEDAMDSVLDLELGGEDDCIPSPAF